MPSPVPNNRNTTLQRPDLSTLLFHMAPATQQTLRLLYPRGVGQHGCPLVRTSCLEAAMADMQAWQAATSTQLIGYELPLGRTCAVVIAGDDLVPAYRGVDIDQADVVIRVAMGRQHHPDAGPGRRTSYYLRKRAPTTMGRGKITLKMRPGVRLQTSEIFQAADRVASRRMRAAKKKQPLTVLACPLERKGPSTCWTDTSNEPILRFSPAVMSQAVTGGSQGPLWLAVQLAAATCHTTRLYIGRDTHMLANNWRMALQNLLNSAQRRASPPLPPPPLPLYNWSLPPPLWATETLRGAEHDVNCPGWDGMPKEVGCQIQCRDKYCSNAKAAISALERSGIVTPHAFVSHCPERKGMWVTLKGGMDDRAYMQGNTSCDRICEGELSQLAIQRKMARHTELCSSPVGSLTMSAEYLHARNIVVDVRRQRCAGPKRTFHRCFLHLPCKPVGQPNHDSLRTILKAGCEKQLELAAAMEARAAKAAMNRHTGNTTNSTESADELTIFVTREDMGNYAHHMPGMVRLWWWCV